MTALERIAAERLRQQERFDHTHDDTHTDGALAVAAACYAIHHTNANIVTLGVRGMRDAWPFEDRYDRRNEYDVVRRLTIAGALILAELERVERAIAAGEDFDEG